MGRQTTDSEATQNYHPVWMGERRQQDIRDVVDGIVEEVRKRVFKVVEFQKNKLGVISPSVAYLSADHAASWRWILTNHIIFLQRALKIIPEDDEIGDRVDELEELFQKYIEAANIVLEEYFKAPNHHGVDLRPEIEKAIYMNRSKYASHQDLLKTHNELRGKVMRRYTID